MGFVQFVQSMKTSVFILAFAFRCIAVNSIADTQKANSELDEYHAALDEERGAEMDDIGDEERDDEIEDGGDEERDDEREDSDDEEEAMNEMFAELDADKDGKVSKDEFFKGEVGDLPTGTEELAFFQKHFANIDRDGDGLLNQREFIEME